MKQRHNHKSNACSNKIKFENSGCSNEMLTAWLLHSPLKISSGIFLIDNSLELTKSNENQKIFIQLQHVNFHPFKIDTIW